MLNDKELKKYVIRSGKNINDVKKLYDKAKKEAKSVGKSNDDFILDIFEDLLELDESRRNKRLTFDFIKSDKSFNDFLEGLVSSDISLDTRPEMHVKRNIKDKIDITEREMDGTGPEGKGPKTGRGLGICIDEDEIEEDLLIKKGKDKTVLDSDVVEKEDKTLLYGDEEDENL